MEKNYIEQYVSENIFSSENGIKVTFSLTGNDMPNEFKYYLRDEISSYIADIIANNNMDNIFKNGRTEFDITKIGKIKMQEKLTLTLTLLPDGTFTNDFVVNYACQSETYKHPRYLQRTFKEYDIPTDYATTYKATALRLLKRLAKKGLNNPCSLNKDCG